MVAMKNHALNILALGAAGASALTTSAAGTKSGCFYSVSGVGSFNTNLKYTFDKTTVAGSITDLISSTYTVGAGNSPLARRFDEANFNWDSSSSAITLTVPGGQTTGPISSAQLVTNYTDILYASVRTVAKISGVAGTTHGFSFYGNDTQEIDFAFLSSNTTLVHLTNEQVDSTSAATSYTYAAPSDATTAFHEYRVDWVAGKTMFYIDSVLIQTITGNVPSTPGLWLWNNWSNGNSWAAGPPTDDSVLEISSIDAYFNRTSVSTTGSCASSSSSSSSSASSTSSKLSSSTASTVSTSSSSKASSSTVSSVSSSSSSKVSSSSSTTVKASSTSTSYSYAPTATSGVTLCPTYNNTIFVGTNGGQYQIGCGLDYAGGDLSMVWVSNLAQCIDACDSTSKCVDVSLSGTACYMKSTSTTAQANSGVNGARLISS